MHVLRNLTESSAVTAARALATKSAMKRLGIKPTKPSRPKPHNKGRAVVWRELLDTLEEVVTRFPQPAREIRSAFENTWGPINDRRFWRALRTLDEQGRIVRSGSQPYVLYSRPVMWPRNLANCIADAAACVAVYEHGYRRAA